MKLLEGIYNIYSLHITVYLQLLPIGITTYKNKWVSSCIPSMYKNKLKCKEKVLKTLLYKDERIYLVGTHIAK